MLGSAVFALVRRLFALRNGFLHCLVVEAVGLEHQLLRVQELRLKPDPGQLFRSHAMVLEKAAGGKGRSPKDAHPAHFLAPDKGA